MTILQQLISDKTPILSEAAVIERIRRSGKELHKTLITAPFIYSEDGKKALSSIYQEYIAIAQKHNLPLILSTPTWRTNQKRVGASEVPHHINRDAITFMRELKADKNLFIAGLMGCKYDCYKPKEALSIEEAYTFHKWQIEELQEADFLLASTLPALSEALGIALQMAEHQTPYAISLVIGKDGNLLDGTPLDEAVLTIDKKTSTPPLGYLINCSYPTFLLNTTLSDDTQKRIIGFQGNGSSLSHDELDNAKELVQEPVEKWGEDMLKLYREVGISILGGCCGTDGDYLEYIAKRIG